MRVISLLLLAALAAAVHGAHAQQPVRQGRALVEEFCARCHAVGRSGRSRHVGAPPFRTLGRSFDLDEFPRMLERGIATGHPDMPSFKFTVDDANAVRAYLRTIQQ
jgi:mono/diheme cytochrome c family protein